MTVNLLKLLNSLLEIPGTIIIVKCKTLGNTDIFFRKFHVSILYNMIKFKKQYF